MNRLLFPTDFSAAAGNAFRYAAALARDLNAELDVLHVFHLPIADAANIPPEHVQQMIDEAEARARQELKAFVKEYEERPFEGKQSTLFGLFTPTEIADYARQQEADLIVMGTKGDRGAFEKFLGSVTTGVQLQAHCPVLAVPAEARYEGIRHIAYATAFDPGDTEALQGLMNLAGRLDAMVHFVHINTQSSRRDIQDLSLLRDGVFQFTDISVVNNPDLQQGLEEYLAQRNIDCLVLFIPHRRLWERLFHSSFTRKMTFHTQLPLLVYRQA
jgi:nucleotide-binding universal stress UspA family protein